ncbi:MAG: HK97 family phage prohead protease, partial [Terriglobales bacterium]
MKPEEFKAAYEIERRVFPVADFRVETRDGKPVIEGHAAVFGQKAEIWGFTEEVAPGAFRESIGKDDVRALFNHNESYVLGRNTVGTLRLKEDQTG